MGTEQRHEMQLETVHPSGAQEWACPTCGRRFIAQWEPRFRRVILQAGQEQIVHVGQAMDLLNDISVRSAENDLDHDPKLQDVWKRWLDQFEAGSDEDPDQSTAN